MLRGIDHVGQNAIGVDTHGLAQRGGIVVSQIRVGDEAYSPIVSKKSADLVVSLERHDVKAMQDLMSGSMLEQNLELFKKMCN
jgi:indolepyruvate ferredoxin oxidoreductase beta subunit